MSERDVLLLARPTRRMQPWEIERAKLAAWQRDRRRADRPAGVEGIDLTLLGASVTKLALILRVEAEARRCSCPPPYPLP